MHSRLGSGAWEDSHAREFAESSVGAENTSAVRSFSFTMAFPMEKHIKSVEKVNDRTALENTAVVIGKVGRTT